MTYFSLFTGVGGFEIGIENAYGLQNNSETRGCGQKKELSEQRSGNLGEQPNIRQCATCIGFSEIDKYANQVLKYRFPNTKNYGDITKINWSEVPDFDLLVGGSPCQDFSIAGKRAGILGERSGLVWEFIRCLEEKKPRYFIWENVKGVMSSRRGYDFANIITAFSEVGYSLWWQVLNAKDFGVPQNRERVFVCGFRGESPREVFFNRGGDEIDNGEGGDKLSEQATNTIRTNYSNGFANETYVQDTKIRRLTPTECERLMSWPDNWTKYGINEKGEKVEMSDTQRYKMCGNGVVSKVVEEIVKNLFL